jgi:HD-GYP domain-containing protein (c-di-GMP phosphodiesterase class II)
MSSGPREDVLSLAGDGSPPSELELNAATLVRARGATLLGALERHLPDARDHADGTASYAFALAAELGAALADAELIAETARLHEVGLVYVPSTVLAGPSEELSPAQRGLVDSHPARGAELARGAGVPERVCEWIRESGERFDGSGPGGLAGERIALPARVVRAACACDALLTMGSRSDPHDAHRAAIARLRKAAGRELDPRLVEVLGGIVERAATSGR